MRDTRTLVQPEQLPAKMTVGTAVSALLKASADTAVLGELVREGTGMRVTLIIVDKDGSSTVSLVRAGDGDVRGLAAGVLTNEGHDYYEPSEPVKQEPVKVGPKVGRNDPCPCGSGKKYKQCHGREA